MGYIISSNKNDNNVKIYDNNELIFYNEEESISNIIYYDEFIINNKMNNINLKVVNLEDLIENESHEWINFYNKDSWENIFWLLGYEIYNEKNNHRMEDIVNNKDEIVLFYIQNVFFIFKIFGKGEKIKRFKDLCDYYENNILNKENNMLFLSIIKKCKDEWKII